jgi:hypothetical protein
VRFVFDFRFDVSVVLLFVRRFDLFQHLFFSFFIHSSVPGAGIEPALADSETAVLPLNNPDKQWKTREGSNLHAPASKAGALPIKLRIYARRADSTTELVTSSPPLSLHPF